MINPTLEYFWLNREVLRSHLESLRQTRLQQRRFRRDPNNYLLELETKLIQSILPL